MVKKLILAVKEGGGPTEGSCRLLLIVGRGRFATIGILFYCSEISWF